MQTTCRRGVFIVALGLAAVLLPLASPPLAADSCTAGIGSNFNGTPIAGGNSVWFNAIAKVTGASAGASVRFDSSTITFTAAGTAYSLDVPANTIVFSPTATTATATFDGTGWTTTVPASYSGNVFLAGLAFPVPAGGLPGGIKPVNWSGQFTSGATGLSVQWKWAAAVYTQFSAAPGAEGVKPIDGGQANPYANSDHAGTPENFKAFVTGGARGGGGSNWTGSYSGTMSVVPCNPAVEVESAFAESSVVSGRTSSFTITATNGTGATTNLNLSDVVDPELVVGSITVDQGDGTCSAGGQTVSCQFSALAAGATAQITVQFLAFGPAGGCTGGTCPVNNCATATDDTGDSATGCATVQVIVIPE